MTPTSFQAALPAPAAVVSNGLVTVPLWAVGSLTLNQTQDMPSADGQGRPTGVSRPRSMLSMTAVLLGPERFAWKLALESLALPERSLAGLASKLSGPAQKATGAGSGLIVLTSVAVSTNMQLTNLTFSVSAARRDVIDVSLSLVQLPGSAPLAALVGAPGFAISALGMWEGG